MDDVNAVIETPEVEESISLREVIENAQAEQRARDDSGRFAKKETPEPVEKPAPEIEAIQEAKQEIKDEAEAKPDRPSLAPNSFSPAAKAKWAEVPAEVAAEIARREADIHKEFTKQDGERQFGKSLKSVIDPYMPLIAQAGGNPTTAIKNLLETARVLATADPATKAQLIRGLAQQHGVSLEGEVPRIDPTLQHITQRLQSFEEQQRQQQYAAQQQQQAELQSAIGQFAADPKNIHFEQVKPHMAALLQSGLAASLQDAYDQAVYARPDIRSTLIAQQQQSGEEKRLAEMKAKADAARRAGGSVTGSPGLGSSADPKAGTRSLGEELRSAFSQHRI